MIRIVEISDFSHKQKIFNEFVPLNSSWVVADLQSRSFLQSALLKEHVAIEDASVMIANELWRDLLFNCDPEYRVISEDLARSLVWDWVKPLNLSWAKTPASARRILQQLDYLSPILASEGSESVINEWFNENPESLFRWGHWFQIGKRLWKEFESRKLCLNIWIPSLLVQKYKPRWHRNLFVDLGVRSSGVEHQVIQEIAKSTEVTVLVPAPTWVSRFPAATEAYRAVRKDQPRPNNTSLFEPRSKPQFLRFATHLAEVKDATAQTREWIDQGVEPAQIVIVAPDIETYLLPLRMHLEEEGIPIRRDLSEPLHSLSSVQEWLSRLRLHIERFKLADLETWIFSSENPSLRYEEFRKLYGNFYGVDDIHRSKEIATQIGERPRAQMSQVEFAEWAATLSPPNLLIEHVESLIKEFCQHEIENLKLDVEVWMGMFEDLAARMTVSSKAADKDGVHLLGIGSSEWVGGTHLYFMNASENALKLTSESPFSFNEADRLLRDLGFGVSSYDSQPAEFELCWFLDRDWQEVNFSFAAANFDGEALTPSRFWLQGAYSTADWKATKSPRLTRWDQVLRLKPSNLAELREWPDEKAKRISAAIQRDHGISPNLELSFLPQHLSVTSLERYLDCPFMFTAEKIFSLRDDPAIDLDLDPLSRGQLMHQLFSRLTVEPFRAEWSDQELLATIDQCRDREEIKLANDDFWIAIRRAYLKLAKRFLQMESQWRMLSPETKTLAQELEFDCYWRDGKWQREPGSGMRLRGRIDRVDAVDDGLYSVIDYKSSRTGITHWNRWVESGQLQLAVYSDILSAGLTTLAKGDVVSAEYYVPREQTRGIGFCLTGFETQLQPNRYNKMSLEQWAELREQSRGLVGDVIQKMNAGNYGPKPKEVSLCEGCTWSRICRASHLN